MWNFATKIATVCIFREWSETAVFLVAFLITCVSICKCVCAFQDVDLLDSWNPAQTS